MASFGIKFHSYLYGPWEEARDSLAQELSSLHTAIRSNWDDVFDKNNNLRVQAPSTTLTPPGFVTDVNDYTPTGFATASLLRISTDVSRNLTGLAGGSEGRTISIVNVGAQNLVIKMQDANSQSVNRFAIAADITLGTDEGAIFIYDKKSTRWRCVGRS